VETRRGKKNGKGREEKKRAGHPTTTSKLRKKSGVAFEVGGQGRPGSPSSGGFGTRIKSKRRTGVDRQSVF